MALPKFQFLKTYDFGENYVTIAGITIGGFDDDGTIEYEGMEDEGELSVGADGEATFSKSNNRAMFVTITLKETSNSVFELDALRKAQQLAGKIPPVSFLHTDKFTGDIVASAYAVLLSSALPNKARMAGTRQYRFALPYGKQSVLEGTKNSIVF